MFELQALIEKHKERPVFRTNCKVERTLEPGPLYPI